MTDPVLPSIQYVDASFPANPKPAPLPYPDPTKSFWLHSSPDCNPLADVGAETPLPDAVDVAIIGSGHSGICVLYHLVAQLRTSNRNVTRIAVFEARQFCSGATGRNGGHCTAFLPAAFDTMTKRDGLQDALRHIDLEQRSVDFVINTIKENNWEDDVDLAEGGAVHLIRTQEESDILLREVEAARKADVDVSKYHFLDRKQCSELTHTREHLTALQYPGNNLYPLRFIDKLFVLAQQKAAAIGIDVTLHTHTPVTSIAQAPGSLWYLDTPRGRVSTRQVVHATNAWASHLLPQLVTGKQRLVPCRGQVIAARPKQESAFWTTGLLYNEGFEYFFQRPQGRRTGDQIIPYVILGGGRSVAPKPFELDVADDTSLQTPEVSSYLLNFLPHHFPSLFPPKEPVMADYHWTGLMCFTPSRDPYVGPVYQDGKRQVGQFLLAGWSGHGMSRVPASAEAIAIMMAAELESKQAPDIPWLPSHFLTTP